MTTIHATTSSHALLERGGVRKNVHTDRGLVFAAALFLAVAVVELTIIVVAAGSLADIGALYATVT
jgi:hypothetical protein